MVLQFDKLSVHDQSLFTEHMFLLFCFFAIVLVIEKAHAECNFMSIHYIGDPLQIFCQFSQR
jgi:hypothetical protein